MMTKKLNLQGTKLSALQSLDSKVTVYIPSTVNINQTIDTAEQVDQCALLLSNLFGGATSTKSNGYWSSPTAGLVKEETTLVYAYCDDKTLYEVIDKVVSYCETLKSELSQDAIALELNGEMFFI